MKHVGDISHALRRVALLFLSAVAMNACMEQPGIIHCDDNSGCPVDYVCHSGTCIQPDVCGNGIQEPGEVCDDGNQMNDDGCSADCLSNETCGNDTLDWAAGEVCDDGNDMNGDGCSADCLSNETCGNDVLDSAAGEACDDGNRTPGDGCSADCLSNETCGNDVLDSEADEDCDDGNTTPGDGCEADCTRSSPVALVTQGLHTCALLAADVVRCWGANDVGQLGYGHSDTIGNNEVPAVAGNVNVGGTVRALATGHGHTCALLEDGRVRCWGRPFEGQLGYGNTDRIGDDELPSEAGDVDVGGPVRELAAGAMHTCALLVSGAVRCWGENESGQLGYGHKNDIGNDELPSTTGDVDVGGTVVALAAGDFHTCALLEGGRVRCWGSNYAGQLGYGHKNDIGNDELPSAAGDVDVGGPVRELAAGHAHTCALLEDGRVRCWGRNDLGQLGYGHVVPIGDDELPSAAGDVDVGGPVHKLATGHYHTCALLSTGAVRCWGNNAFGQLGYGNTNHIGDDELPSAVGYVPLGGLVEALAAGEDHVCALLDTGAVRCWGRNTEGQLGYGHIRSIGDDELPSGDVEVGG